MLVNSKNTGDWDGQFLTHNPYGFRNAKIHATANLIGDIEIGANTRIDGFVTITGCVRIGRNCHIATGACLFGGEGIVIGDHCGISAGVKIFTATDDPDLGLLALHMGNELPRGAKNGQVLMGKYVTIGANCVIYPGVTITDEVMVGAMSFVNRDLLLRYIYAGTPVRSMRERPPLKYTKAAA